MTDARVAQLAAARLGVAVERLAVAPHAKAYGHQTFLVSSPGGRWLVKVAREPAEVERLRWTAEAAARARAAGVATPEILAVGTDALVDGRAYLVQTYLPGQDAEEAWPALGEAERAAFLEALGRAAARLHGVENARFTEGAVAEAQGADWAAHVAVRTENLRRYNRRAAVVAPADLEAAIAEIRALAARTAGVVAPRLVHRDLFLRNALVDRGAFAALLDFEHARYTDPAIEFVKLGLMLFEKVPGSEAAFRRGYGDPLPMEAERYRAALGLELLGGIPFFARNAMRTELEDYTARLGRWLAS